MPTSTSLIFYEEVQRNFEQLERLRGFAQDLLEGRERSLSLGATSSLSNSVVPRIVSEYHKHNPNQRLTLHTLSSAMVAHKVQLQELDIGLISPRSLLPSMEVARRYSLPSVCLSIPGHSLTEKRIIGVDEIVAYPLILPSSHTTTGANIDDIFRRIDVVPEIVVRCQLTITVSLLVHQGLGIGVADGWTASTHKLPGGSISIIDPEIGNDIIAIVNKNYKYSRSSDMIDILDESFTRERDSITIL